MAVTRAEALAALKAESRDVAPGQAFSARPFRPEDAPGVAKLFYHIYGGSYPFDYPYIPEQLVAKHAADGLRTVVAVTDDGSIIGQAATFISSAPNPKLWECGGLMVNHGYRGCGVARELSRVFAGLIAGGSGLDGTFFESVAHQPASQKLAQRLGGAFCGLEAGLMPDGAYAGEGVRGRASCFLSVFLNAVGEGPLFLPEPWAERITTLTPSWKLSRTAGPAPERPQVPARTELATQRFDFAGVTRLTLTRAGADLAERLAAETAAAASAGHALFQVFLCLGDSACGVAAAVLRRAGFFFGGFLPQWFGHAGPGPDALLVQRQLVPMRIAEVKCCSAAGERLADMVMADRAAAQAEGAAG